MTFEIALVFAILLGTLIIFILDWYPMDFVAFGLLAVMLVVGPILGLTTNEIISGFSNSATITVMAMFILSGGIDRTGMVNILSHHVSRWAGKSETRQLAVVMAIVGPISAFINNTATVAILMPLVITLARQNHRSPSKLLIPLSYGSQLGGVMTLIGTSTNVLASSMAADRGYGQFGMFDFTVIGLCVYITGALYVIFIAPRLLPERRKDEEITKTYRVTEYLTEVIVLKKSPLIGHAVSDSHLSDEFDIRILEIVRHGQKLPRPVVDKVLQAGDVLLVKANPQRLAEMKDTKGLAIHTKAILGEDDLATSKMGLLEVIVAPNSHLVGGTLASTNFRARYGCTVIAMQKAGDLIWECLPQVQLDLGDTMLLRGTNAALDQIKRDADFIVTQEVKPEMFRTEKIPVALAIIFGVVISAALGYEILITSIIGCVLLVLTGCLKVNELHESIRWDVILLLAGVLPLGLALEKTGGAVWLANIAVYAADYVPSLGVLAIFYLISMVLTEFISNNATVVILVPVGIATAEKLGLDPRAFVLAIMFAASTSFSTPVGYQTNTMVYGPGGYKFFDFTRVGLPLNLMLAVVTPIFIYFLWGI